MWRGRGGGSERELGERVERGEKNVLRIRQRKGVERGETTKRKSRGMERQMRTWEKYS